MGQSQWSEAERAYKEALENNPGMARPHLDLAIIYQQHNPNYIHAIYHYDRYLELRPDSEKAALIREQRAKVMRALEVETIKNSPEWKQVVIDVEKLLKENAALKNQLATAQPAPSSSASKPTAEAPADEGEAASGHRIYTVVAGDTLTSIAARFYGDGESWEPIYEANRNSLSSPSSLRVGQTLVIPAKEN
jgi:LysM repeat protein